ncbi:MAG: hypothetical protein A3E01_14265 [Gammaproteobacteria bacterium RIFCSPHIGHO2_12_FULL_63_22]|nr:MAG: hypothetical protein A3E01_14265 [Gammaproteobacteria bacterium RIFCSPHIGHO2_12_FULL_63_22]
MTNTKLEAAVKVEWQRANSAVADGDLGIAFAHLERAHILSQRLTLMHVRTHVAMFRIGWRRRDLHELLGQMARIVAATFFSRIWVPIGNTGGANVSAFRPMPVPDDLNAVLNEIV